MRRVATPTNPSARMLRYELSRAQRDFLADETRFTAFVGGIGSGKTFAGALRALSRIFPRERPTIGMIVAPTYRMLLDATWRTCLAVWEPLLVEQHRAELRLVLVGGHEVLFRSADDPDRLRGPNLHWAWIDEAALCAAQTWPILIGRLRADGEAGPAWLTTTPKGFNWVYDLIQDGMVSAHRATTMDNPFLPAAFVAELRRQYPADFARQELGGEFLQLGAGLIRRDWFAVVDHAPAGLRWVRFWDLAVSTKTSADYTASVRLAQAQGTYYLADLIHGRWEWPEVRQLILDTIRAEPDTRLVAVEATAFQLAAVQELRRALGAHRVALAGVHPDRDKLARALPWIAAAEAGNFRLVAPTAATSRAWGPALTELEAFPDSPHDDIVDAISGAWAALARVTQQTRAIMPGGPTRDSPWKEPRR